MPSTSERTTNPDDQPKNPSAQPDRGYRTARNGAAVNKKNRRSSPRTIPEYKTLDQLIASAPGGEDGKKRARALFIGLFEDLAKPVKGRYGTHARRWARLREPLTAATYPHFLRCEEEWRADVARDLSFCGGTNERLKTQRQKIRACVFSAVAHARNLTPEQDLHRVSEWGGLGHRPQTICYRAPWRHSTNGKDLLALFAMALTGPNSSAIARRLEADGAEEPLRQLLRCLYEDDERAKSSKRLLALMRRHKVPTTLESIERLMDDDSWTDRNYYYEEWAWGQGSTHPRLIGRMLANPVHCTASEAVERSRSRAWTSADTARMAEAYMTIARRFNKRALLNVWLRAHEGILEGPEGFSSAVKALVDRVLPLEGDDWAEGARRINDDHYQRISGLIPGGEEELLRRVEQAGGFLAWNGGDVHGPVARVAIDMAIRRHGGDWSAAVRELYGSARRLYDKDPISKGNEEALRVFGGGAFRTEHLNKTRGRTALSYMPQGIESAYWCALDEGYCTDMHNAGTSLCKKGSYGYYVSVSQNIVAAGNVVRAARLTLGKKTAERLLEETADGKCVLKDNKKSIPMGFHTRRWGTRLIRALEEHEPELFALWCEPFSYLPVSSVERLIGFRDWADDETREAARSLHAPLRAIWDYRDKVGVSNPRWAQADKDFPGLPETPYNADGLPPVHINAARTCDTYPRWDEAQPRETDAHWALALTGLGLPVPTPLFERLDGHPEIQGFVLSRASHNSPEDGHHSSEWEFWHRLDDDMREMVLEDLEWIGGFRSHQADYYRILRPDAAPTRLERVANLYARIKNRPGNVCEPWWGLLVAAELADYTRSDAPSVFGDAAPVLAFLIDLLEDHKKRGRESFAWRVFHRDGLITACNTVTWSIPPDAVRERVDIREAIRAIALGIQEEVGYMGFKGRWEEIGEESDTWKESFTYDRFQWDGPNEDGYEYMTFGAREY